MSFENILEIINNIFYLRIDSAMDAVKAIAEILIFTYLFYKLLNIIKETRAWQLLKGIIFLVLITALSDILGFRTLSFVLNNTFNLMAIGVFVIFQPELRRGLEQIGRSSLKGFFSSDVDITNTTNTIEELVRGCMELSKTSTGALIVIERDTKIGDIINTGITLDSEVTAELMINIFTPNTPLHDGAIIIRNNRIKAATCYLPLTDNRDISKELGTRHRAAIGATEVSDAIVIVVSEETGKVSFIMNGEITRGLQGDQLRVLLRENLIDLSAQTRKISFFKGERLK